MIDVHTDVHGVESDVAGSIWGDHLVIGGLELLH